MTFKPGITVAMIARDEARCIERCILSVKDWATEVVVVDTGSSDDTAKIAERLGARVKRIEWPGDFSVARNAALDMVETEWTLAMDADEWFESDMGPIMLTAIQDQSVVGYQMACRNLFPDGRWTEQLSFRLWRTHPDLRFTGVIHEHMAEEAKAEALKRGVAKNVGMWFWHDGYSDRTKEKAARNLPLLERELELRPGQLYYEIELAMTYQDVDDPRAHQAMSDLKERILLMSDLDEAPTSALSTVIVRLLQRIPDEELRFAEVDALIRVARGWFGDVPAVLSMIGQTEIRKGDLRAAFSTFTDLERMVASGSYNRTISTNPALINEHLFTNLALVAHQLGRNDVAKRNYERLLAIDPSNALARQNLDSL